MPTEKCHGAAKKARWVRCSTVCLNLKLPDVSALLRTPSQTLLLALEYGRISGFKSALAFLHRAFGTLAA